MLPRPNTAEPSVTTAIVFLLIVRRRASAGFSAIARHTRATPGVYARDKSSRCLSGTLGVTSILPPKCSRKVRSDTFRTLKPSSAAIAFVIDSECATSLALQLTSTTSMLGCDSATSSAVIAPPASATTLERRGGGAGAGGGPRRGG